ncbi:MAG: DUF418 domain-containing protein [Gammaproteobacteria bacterium]|nr:DUF418 domain-containing protein [Gammaproteobacteria bacterium]
MTATMQPVSQAERHHELDALRGFLLFFIFAVNLPGMTLWWANSEAQKAAILAMNGNAWLYELLEVLVRGKFYSLFSLLFGIGFAVILSRIEARGLDSLAVYRRRMYALLGIGLLHMLWWSGDILTPYALCGLALLLFRNVRDRTLLWLAAGCILFPVLQYWAGWASDEKLNVAGPLYTFLESERVMSFIHPEGPMAAIQRGGVGDLLAFSLIGFGYRWADLLWEGRFFKIFGMFLIGLWAGRQIVAGSLLSDTRLLKRIFLVGLLVGLPLNIYRFYLTGDAPDWPMGPEGFKQFIGYALGVVPLALAYAAGIVLLWKTRIGQRLLTPFVPLGRMALTNYLMQSLIGVGLFHFVLPEKLGSLGPIDWIGFAAFVIALQMMFSRWWLARHRFGPLEKLWRTATYGREAVKT